MLDQDAASSRLRLVVVQVLVLSLFATLFARLWYIQVVGGDDYQAQAADTRSATSSSSPPRADRRRHGPAAGRQPHVVGGHRRPRPCSASWRDDRSDAVLARLAGAVGLPARRARGRALLTCGEPGAVSRRSAGTARPTSRCRSPRTSPQQVAAAILEQGEDYPGVARRAAERCAPTRRRSASTPPTCSATSARSPRTSSTPPTERRRHARVNGASVVGRAGLEKAYDRWLRGMPGYQRVAVDSMGRVLGDYGERRQPTPGDTLVTSHRRQGAGGRRAAARADRSRPRARPLDPVTHRNYVADSGSVVVLDAKNGRVVAMASYPTYDPNVWVGGISQGELDRLYSAKAGTPLLSPRHPGPVRARARRGSRS